MYMNGFYMIVAIFSVIGILITFFLGRFFRRKPYIKYIPTVFAALTGIGFYIKSRYFAEGFEDLGYVVLTLIACIVFILSFLTAFILGLVQRKSE